MADKTIQANAERGLVKQMLLLGGIILIGTHASVGLICYNYGLHVGRQKELTAVTEYVTDFTSRTKKQMCNDMSYNNYLSGSNQFEIGESSGLQRSIDSLTVVEEILSARAEWVNLKLAITNSDFTYYHLKPANSDKTGTNPELETGEAK